MAKTTLGAPATLSSNAGLDGLTISAKPVFNGTSAIIKNCAFENIELPDKQSDHLASSIIGPKGWNDLRLVVEDCEFAEHEKAYNAFELNAVLSDGSSISNNIFDLAVCTHNIINIYDVEDGATININDNVFAKAANGIRVGIKDAREDVTININRNEYAVTDSGEYAGLVLIQPYGTATTDMGGITININDTINKSGEEQIWYYYAGAKDTQLTVEQRPKVYINGELQHYKDEIIEENTEEEEEVASESNYKIVE